MAILGFLRLGQHLARLAPGQIVSDSDPHHLLEPLEQRVLLSTVQILPLGDSITQGGTDWNSYRRPLYHMLTEAGYDVDFIGSVKANPPNPDFDLDHEGHGGWRIDELAEGRSHQPEKGSLPQWLQTYTPDLVLLHAGTNDIIQGGSNGAVHHHDIRKVINILREDNPNVTIFLAKVIPADFKEGVYETVQQFNDTLPGVVADMSTSNSKIILVDQWTGFDVDSDTYDGLHPDGSGEQKMAQRWFDAIDAYLKGAGGNEDDDNDDDDGGEVDTTPGQIIVSPHSGLVTSESGGKANFSISLTKAPTANVTINLSVSKPSEAALSTTSIVFTPGNWSSAKTVTVTGLDDDVDDGDVQYTIVTAPAVSADSKYHGQNAANITAINLDNDEPIPPDAFGNKKKTPTTIAPVSDPIVINEHVGDAADPQDWLRFKVGKNSVIEASLTGLDANADLELWHGNRRVAVSHNAGDADESLSFSVRAAGFYFLRIYTVDGVMTDYRLALSALTAGQASSPPPPSEPPAPPPPPPPGPTTDDAFGNKLKSPTTIAPVSSPIVFNDHVGAGNDPQDWLRFHVAGGTVISAALTGLDAHVDFELWHGSRRVAGSYNAGTADETLDFAVRRAGYYLLRIYTTDGIVTPYELTLSALPADGTTTSTPTPQTPKKPKPAPAPKPTVTTRSDAGRDSSRDRRR